MDLNDLLADVDGIGSDVFIPSQTEGAPPPPARVSAEPAALLPPTAPAPAGTVTDALAMVRDAELDLSVELGTAHLPLRMVMTLAQGGQFTLDTGPGQPLKIFVGDHCIGAGEALLIDGHLAIRITDLLHTAPVSR
jgi:flagellar motor switch protein FliN/FliY